MQDLIDNYFATHLSLSANDAIALHKKYYTEYGLALAGLIKHHKIDPLDYNSKVDDALPLEDVLSRDEGLIRLLEGIDRRKVKLWLVTNAYVTHAKRVVKLLGVEHFFEGVTYCDYSAKEFLAKPDRRFFLKAEREVGVRAGEGEGERVQGRDIYFVDDSRLNCRAAKEVGWKALRKGEDGEGTGGWEGEGGLVTVERLDELKEIWSELFQ